MKSPTRLRPALGVSFLFGLLAPTACGETPEPSLDAVTDASPQALPRPLQPEAGVAPAPPPDPGGRDADIVPPPQSSGNCDVDSDCGVEADAGLLGMCSMHFCVCHEGFHVQASGHCGSAQVACVDQGAVCASPNECVQREHGDDATNATCGDAGTTTCCFETHCKTPGWLVGCNPTDQPAFCSNGWLTCPPGVAFQQFYD